VEEVGVQVEGVQVGDDVICLVGGGAFAEYARVRADAVVPKPARLTFEQAAALPTAGETALRGIRDAGRVQAGQRVLVNGAAGGVGSFAVQIAAALGAEVTGVCSARNVDLVASLGAAHVVDYTREDFTAGEIRYDVIFDNIGNRKLSSLRRALTPRGTLVYNSGGPPEGRVFGPIASILKVVLANAVTRQRLRPLGSNWKRQDLLDLTELVDAGKVTPVIDRTYPLADTAAGLSYLEAGHARGKVVLTVS
jgi:NADPH:quinone reductase-like Zn-dependent oxidoreductase